MTESLPPNKNSSTTPFITHLQGEKELWDLFTRVEEYKPSLRDRYDRFPFYASNCRDIFDPRVSHFLVQRGLHLVYPEDRPFAVCLTHDIDSVYQAVFKKGVSALRSMEHGAFSDAIRTVCGLRRKKQPFCNFSEIMDLEEEYEATSTFFVMSEDPDSPDYGYDIEDQEAEIGEIIDRAWEVGLHGGNNTYLNPVEMKEKRERIERITRRPVLGYRSHLLKIQVPDTWEYLAQAGFRYDSTLGYADCAGFRSGMCHPFHPFNLGTGKEIPLWEIPLVLMDVSLGHSYMRLSAEDVWKVTRTLIDQVAQCHGVFTLLWHNTNLRPDGIRYYRRILEYCRDKGAWMTSGEQILALVAE